MQQSRHDLPNGAVVLAVLALLLLSLDRPLPSAEAASSLPLIPRSMLDASAGCHVDGCRPEYCAMPKCLRCMNNLVLNRTTGLCGCPSGRFFESGRCLECPKGSYCPGGIYSEARTLSCKGLTTIGLRTTTVNGCVNLPGTYYVLNADGTPSFQPCPEDTYGPGLRKQRNCVPCPPGLGTNTLHGRSRLTACVVPLGHILDAEGALAPCPKGTYRSDVSAKFCTSCAVGVTTPQAGSTSIRECHHLLPGYYVREFQYE